MIDQSRKELVPRIDRGRIRSYNLKKIVSPVKEILRHGIARSQEGFRSRPYSVTCHNAMKIRSEASCPSIIIERKLNCVFKDTQNLKNLSKKTIPLIQYHHQMLRSPPHAYQPVPALGDGKLGS